MATTVNQGWPYPDGSDDPDIPRDIQMLAQAAEKQSVMSFIDAADRASKLPSPVAGMVTFLSSANRFDVRIFGAWVEITVMAARALLTRTATNMAIPDDNNEHWIDWTAFGVDNLNGWAGAGSLHPERYTVALAGFYAVDAWAAWASSSAGNTRRLGIYLNGVKIVETDSKPVGGSLSTQQTVAASNIFCSNGDYLDIRGRQDSGGSLDISSSRMSLWRMYS